MTKTLLLLCALALGIASGCMKRGTVVETEPVAANIASYWTCAVSFASDGRGADANEGFNFVPWFEGRVREAAVFEPLARDEGAEAEVTLKLEASQGDERVTLRLLVIDTRTKASLGELEAEGVVSAKDAGDAGDPPRVLAMRNAADQILALLKEKRRLSMAQIKRAPPGPALPEGPPVGGSASCATQCLAPAASVSSHDEQYRVSAGINATMKELRACLDRIGAQLVVPAVLLRFSPDGQLRHMRVDVGGYEQMECIQSIKARVPRSVWTSRASLLRCEYRCTVS